MRAAAWSVLPACLPVFSRNWLDCRATPHRQHTIICIGTSADPFGAGSDSSDTAINKKQHTRISSSSRGGDLEATEGPDAVISAPTTTLHLLCPVLKNTATTSPSFLPMPLSSAAPLTSLASIWIEAPCFSSYKSR